METQVKASYEDVVELLADIILECKQDEDSKKANKQS